MRRTRRKKNHIALPIIVATLIISCFALYHSISFIEAAVSGNSNTAGVFTSEISANHINQKDIYSEYAVMTDMSTGKILFQKNGDEVCYPASLTKIMTAIVAIEGNSDLDAATYIDEPTITGLNSQNAAMAGYYAYEKTTIRDLLYGCLLASGADASAGLARATAGSESEFVSLMNRKAESLKMSNTHFVNTSGLHDEDHYTTAEDMSKLLKYALTDPTFREIFAAGSHNIKTDIREFTVHSTFFSEYKGNHVDNIQGAKTGTTSAAGNCLASYSESGDRGFVLVTMGAPVGGSGQPFSFDDLDYVLDSV